MAKKSAANWEPHDDRKQTLLFLFLSAWPSIDVQSLKVGHSLASGIVCLAIVKRSCGSPISQQIVCLVIIHYAIRRC